jgi:hypothetical protein
MDQPSGIVWLVSVGLFEKRFMKEYLDLGERVGMERENRGEESGK